MSVRPSPKILFATEPIGLYSSGNISTGPVVVFSYFLGGWDTSNPPIISFLKEGQSPQRLGAKPLVSIIK